MPDLTVPNHNSYHPNIPSPIGPNPVYTPHNIARLGADGDQYPLPRQAGTAAATESRWGSEAGKFPPEPDGECAMRAV